jgi:hypothetical protein
MQLFGEYSRLPVSRFPRMMGQSNHYPRLLNIVDYQRERKLMEHEFFGALPTRRPLYRGERRIGLTQKLDGVFKRRNQPYAKSSLFLLIPYGCFFKFESGILANPNFHSQSSMRALARAKTSVVSNSEVGSASSSLILRQISISHAWALSLSTGPSKLATKSLANLARSVTESAITLVLSISSWAVIIFSGFLKARQIMLQTATHNKALQYAPFVRRAAINGGRRAWHCIVI